MITLNRDAVRNYALRRNKSLREIALDAGVHPRYLYRLLRGDRSPRPSTRHRLCERWGLTFDDLFQVVDEHTVAP